MNAGTRGILSGKGLYSNDFINNVVASALNKETPIKHTIKSAIPVVRTKIGDVEIDNPNLYYRQGTHHIGDDLIDTRVVKEGVSNNVKPVSINGIQLTKKQAFKAPMFSQGKL